MYIPRCKSPEELPYLSKEVLEGPEKLGKVRVVPIHVERPVGKDHEAADNGQPWDCKHEAEIVEKS